MRTEDAGMPQVIWINTQPRSYLLPSTSNSSTCVTHKNHHTGLQDQGSSMVIKYHQAKMALAVSAPSANH